ncbi:MAG: glycosyltransferase family 4 protein [Acholeplasma sp.]|nr:glycosyltransferase family 4 protein [Acholeplasma sp.]
MSKSVLFIVNHEIVIFNFRKELVVKLLDLGYMVYIASPKGNKIKLLVDMGCIHFDIDVNRHGKSIIQDIRLTKSYIKIINKIKPSVVLTYTIKPNIYGGIAARLCKVPYIANITGLGVAVEKKGILQKITTLLYKLALSKVRIVFFQNMENMNYFVNNKVAVGRHILLPGSGVNLEHFEYINYPSEDFVQFVFISRIMREKGIDLYLETAKRIKEIYPKTIFHVCGFCEENYVDILDEYQKNNIIIYHGMLDDVRDILKVSHCIIHPSFYPEGLSNVLLEAAACGRPIITTNRSGCKEVVHNNGFIVEVNDLEDLIGKTIEFINLPSSKKLEMSYFSRKIVEEKFDRSIVVNEYIKIISKL